MDNCLDVKIGFIGAGRMAQALSQGFINAGLVKPVNVMCSDTDSQMLKSVNESLGIQTAASNNDLVANSDVIILAVKPHCVAKALQESNSVLSAQRHLIVSIAAGITTSYLQSLLPEKMRVIRVMPNTPALVQCAASAFCPGSWSLPADCQLVNNLFSSIGYCTQLDEKHLDAVTALSGSGPAYVFMMIEAMADGGVKMGLPRDVAQRLAAQTVMGAGKMVLDTGKHPGELKDMVCSPGGTTIEAIHHLEKCKVRAAFIGAVEAAANKASAIGASNK